MIDVAKPIHEQPTLLQLREAAALLRATTRTLNRWEATGRLRVLRPAGGAPLVARAEIERLLDEGATPRQGAAP